MIIPTELITFIAQAPMSETAEDLRSLSVAIYGQTWEEVTTTTRFRTCLVSDPGECSRRREGNTTEDGDAIGSSGSRFIGGSTSSLLFYKNEKSFTSGKYLTSSKTT